MSKQVLKKPLKIECIRRVDEVLSAGTLIETTDLKCFTNNVMCRIVIADGVEYIAHQAAIDDAMND